MKNTVLEKRDIFADICLNLEEKGGRASPTPIRSFRTTLKIDRNAFSAVFWLGDLGSQLPGSSFETYVGFLNWKLAKQFFVVGVEFEVWELGVIGKGKVLEVSESWGPPVRN